MLRPVRPFVMVVVPRSPQGWQTMLSALSASPWSWTTDQSFGASSWDYTNVQSGFRLVKHAYLQFSNRLRSRSLDARNRAKAIDGDGVGGLLNLQEQARQRHFPALSANNDSPNRHPLGRGVELGWYSATWSPLRRIAALSRQPLISRGDGATGRGEPRLGGPSPEGATVPRTQHL
jgi:hypothetical protein